MADWVSLMPHKEKTKKQHQIISRRSTSILLMDHLIIDDVKLIQDLI